ncbi:MAG: DUF1638 domain-containing protein [Methanomassiliicoccales archaeon]
MTIDDPKGTIGIIGCRMFEDEIVYIIEMDDHISNVFIIQNDDSPDIVKKINEKGLGCTVTVIDEKDVPMVSENEGLSILIWIKPMALHSSPEKLKQDILTTLGKLDTTCSSILLFYGLCGNAFKNIVKDTASCKVPVIILKDSGDKIVDDCIGTVLGGTDEYYEQLKKSSGTFFLTPMWASNWRELFHKVQILPDPNDIEGARYIFQAVGYKKVCKMETNLGDQDRFNKDIDEFAGLFDFKKGSVPCTMEVVELSYKRSKEAMR